MLLKDIRESLLRTVGGGITTTADPLSPQYVDKMINSFRAEIIQRNYSKNKTINPICYQRFFLSYAASYQLPNTAFLRFFVPATIQMGDEDGIRFMGSLDGCTEWRRVFNRSELATFNSHKFTKLSNCANKKYTYGLYSSFYQTLEVYNNANLREGMVEAIFANPMQVPGYNIDQDPYPINEDDIAELESLIYRNRTVITKNTSPEYEFNIPADKTSGPPKGENLK